MEQTQTYAQNQTVVGYFNDQDRAEHALDELRDAGFTSAHIGVAHRGFSSSGSATSKTKHAAEGMWDKVKNFFEGGSAEPYADERTRGDMATREITDTSGSGSSYSYSDDDIHHSLTGMSVPEHRSRYFSHKLGTNDKGCILTVNAEGRTADAERILRDNGADLGENASTSTDYTTPSAAAGYAAGSNYDQTRSEYHPPESTSESARESTGFYGSSANREAAYDDRNRNRGQEDVENIQLLGEVLRVHKDRINRGEVVIRKDIVTETQNLQVPVTREELVVERRDVSADTPARGRVGENQEIRIPLTEETASVDKGTVVREEVAVGKRPVQEVRDLSGEVRREELVVDDQTRKRAVNE